MALTRLQMVTEALDNISRVSSGQMRSATTMSEMGARWANRAQVEVARRHDFIFKTSTASTVVGTQTYAFPSNLSSLHDMILESTTSPSQSRKLRCLMHWDYARMVPKPSVIPTNIPTHYIPHKTNLQFDLLPIPNAIYTLRMFHSCLPTDMSLDTSTSDYQTYNVDCDDILVYLITSYGFQYLQELVDSQYWRKMAFDRLEEVYKNVRGTFPDWNPVGRGFGASGYGDYSVTRTFRDDTGLIPNAYGYGDIFQSDI